MEKKGKKILEREILTQVFDDGVSREQSASYHRFDVDFFLLSCLCARKSASPFSVPFVEKLQKMMRYLFILQSPGFGIPAYGDSDDGRGFTLPLPVNFWDVRGLIAAGGAVFQSEEIPIASFLNEESFWLLNEAEWNSPKAIEIIHRLKSAQFYPTAGMSLSGTKSRATIASSGPGSSEWGATDSLRTAITISFPRSST